MLTILRFLFFAIQDFYHPRNTGKSLNTQHLFPTQFYRHSSSHFGEHTKVTSTTASSLPRADNIDTGLPVDTKVVDGPVGMVDCLNGPPPPLTESRFSRLITTR